MSLPRVATRIGLAILAEAPRYPRSDDYRAFPGFSDAEKAAIAWAGCVTERTCRRDREVMAELKAHYTDAQVVEITMVSCYFNMWNRFTDSLEVEIEEHGSVSRIRVPPHWRATPCTIGRPSPVPSPSGLVV